MTFAADHNYHTNLEGQETYLDRASGSLIDTVTDPSRAAALLGETVMEGLEENTALVTENPELYLLVPSMSHGEHHSVIQAFLDSDWTSDKECRDRVRGIYYPLKSIGYWLKNVGDDGAVKAYFAFRDVWHRQLAEAFLRKNGVLNFEWI